MGAWSTIKIDNKYTIGEVKYGVPYFIKFIPKNKIHTDYNKFVATINKKDYIGAMVKLLTISKHPFANYFLYAGIKELEKIPGKVITIDYSDVNLDWQKDLHVHDIVAGNPNITTKELFKINEHNMWLDLMTLTGLLSYETDLVGALKYLKDAYHSNINKFVYLREPKLFGSSPMYKIPILQNKYISSNWINFIGHSHNMTQQFKVFIGTFVKYHKFPIKYYLKSDSSELKPKNFTNKKFAFYDIGVVESSSRI